MASDDLELKATISVTKTGDGIEQATKQVEQLGKAADKTGTAAKVASTSVKQVGGEMKEMGKLAHEAENAMLGLERGGIGGTITALKNFGAMIKTVGAAMGGPLVAALAAVGVAWKVMSDIITANEKAIAKIFEDRKSQIEERKNLTEAMNAAMVKSFKEVAAAATLEASAIKALDVAMAGAAERSKILADAQYNLAKANLEASGKSTKDLETGRARAEVENVGNRAFVENEALAEETQKLQGIETMGKSKLNAAERASQFATEEAGRYSSDNYSSEAVGARNRAAAAAVAYGTAKKEYTSTVTPVQERLYAIGQRRTTLDATMKASKTNLQAFDTTQQTDTRKTGAATQAELSASGAAKYQRGDVGGANEDWAQARNVEAAVKAANKSQAAKDKATVDALRASQHAAAVATEKIRQEKNNQQNRPAIK